MSCLLSFIIILSSYHHQFNLTVAKTMKSYLIFGGVNCQLSCGYVLWLKLDGD